MLSTPELWTPRHRRAPRVECAPMGAGLGFNWQGAKFDNSAFVPTNIAGCVLWLRADLGLTVGTSWLDQSGTGDSNKNMTSSAWPTLNSSDSSYNNQATLSFNRSTPNYVKSGTWASSIPVPWTAFIVGNDDGNSGTGGYYESYFQPSTTTNGNGYIVANNVGTYDWYGGSADQTAGSVSNAPRVLAIVQNGSSSSGYNSAKTAVWSGANIGSGSITGLLLGALVSGSVDGLTGKLAECIIYNSDIGSSNRSLVWNYLGTRYNISIGA